ncbi:hypothetical protein [Mucilaginibacter celer]|uniref:Uncharacterized protein n=1 Tax=Mucilaginibacter celer TaxID=2305508 RepID=A0A494VGW8_9SPHI|nr:hypothetical protein [Mucilaginibacter celer]AYL93836.1 hypothetical protein HYN43_000335 [Mucilaginibacter celer]
MKFFYTLVLAAMVAAQAQAQNTFPTTGNAGIGTTSPTHPLTLSSTSQEAFYNTADQVSNFERVRFAWATNVFTLIAEKNGTGTVRNLRLTSGASNIYIGSTTGTTAGVEIRRDGTSIKTLFAVTSASLNGSLAPQNCVSIVPTIAQTGAASYNGLFISPFESTAGSGASFLINAGTNSAADGAGSHSSKFVVTNAGRVGIGTTTPAEELSVNGNIRAKQVKVETANWPDYVFEQAYKLPSLTDVKTYINQNGHLPEVPSAAEVDKNGQSLGEMNKLLLKKVEELTLYLIEKDKEDKQKDKLLLDLQNRLQQLEKKQSK